MVFNGMVLGSGEAFTNVYCGNRTMTKGDSRTEELNFSPKFALCSFVFLDSGDIVKLRLVAAVNDGNSYGDLVTVKLSNSTLTITNGFSTGNFSYVALG